MGLDHKTGLEVRDGSDRRKTDRREVSRSTSDRRQRDRRRFLRVGAGVLAAATAFVGGARIQLQRHEAGPTQTRLLETLGRTGQSPFKESPSIITHADPLSIALNEPVLKYISAYQGNRRSTFEEALARGGRYLPQIRKVFEDEGVPPDLAYVALVESEFKTGAVSRAKATGLWQFMPKTAKRFGLQQDSWVDERSDPMEATRAAAKYLKHLHGLFGDWNLALAAYNAGEGTVRRALKRQGAGDFWELSRRRALPRETIDYVPKIHAAIMMAREPERYGLEVEPEAPLKALAIETNEPVDLRVVAECAGADLDALKELNPELRRIVTPNRAFDLNVPEERAAEAAQCLASIPAAKRVRVHVVKKGQTLASLARRYGTRAADIAKVNQIGTRSKLPQGTQLIIPPSALRAD